MADSFSVLNELVYEQKVLTLSEYSRIINSNWQGQEHLRKMILNKISGYGNDDEKADRMMNRIFNDYTRIIADRKEAGGVLMPAGISTFGRELEWLRDAGRPFQAYGRDVLATNFPRRRAATKRPTPRSILHQMIYAARGCHAELKLHRHRSRGRGNRAMAALMRTFQNRGWYIHMDVSFGDAAGGSASS